MKKRLLLLLLVFLLLFSACGTDSPQNTEAPTEFLQNVQTDEQPEQTTPPTQSNLKPVVLEIPAKERCASTSQSRFVETETGYYMLRSHAYLFYADKSDLTNWVLVCNEPDCNHSRTYCPAAVDSPVWFRNGYLYFMANRSLRGRNLDGCYIVCMGPDGSDPQPIFTDPSINGNNGPTSWSDGIGKDYFIRCISAMKEDGQVTSTVVKIDADGVRELFTAEYPPPANDSLPVPMPTGAIRGDVVIGSTIALDGTEDLGKDGWENRRDELLYRVHGDTIAPLILTERCNRVGGYLSGDSFWHYHRNEGFYYMDLSTGEEVKIADAAYENANGFCIDGKHMIECTLSVYEYECEIETPQMRYFDGEVWHELEVPGHWRGIDEFWLLAGASDRIFFTVKKYAKSYSDRYYDLCYILLGEDQIILSDTYPYNLDFE